MRTKKPGKPTLKAQFTPAELESLRAVLTPAVAASIAETPQSSPDYVFNTIAAGARGSTIGAMVMRLVLAIDRESEDGSVVFNAMGREWLGKK